VGEEWIHQLRNESTGYLCEHGNEYSVSKEGPKLKTVERPKECSKKLMSNSVSGICNLNLTVVLLQVTKVDFQEASTNEKLVLRSLDPIQGELWNS